MSKVALITGGSRGIGAACVEAFYKEGYRVAFGYCHSSSQALAIESRFPGVLPLCADLTNTKDADAMVESVKSVFGHIDVLVNNAGVSLQKLLPDTTDAEYETVMSVNVKSVFTCCRKILPDMIARKSGVIVNISSMWGQVGASCETVYSASKAAIIGLTRALAKEVGPSGIRVNAIAPGVINTDMISCLNPTCLEALCADTPLGRLGSPEDIARCAVFLSGENATFITGQILGVNGGIII